MLNIKNPDNLKIFFKEFQDLEGSDTAKYLTDHISIKNRFRNQYLLNAQ